MRGKNKNKNTVADDWMTFVHTDLKKKKKCECVSQNCTNTSSRCLTMTRFNTAIILVLLGSAQAFAPQAVNTPRYANLKEKKIERMRKMCQDMCVGWYPKRRRKIGSHMCLSFCLLLDLNVSFSFYLIRTVAMSPLKWLTDPRERLPSR